MTKSRQTQFFLNQVGALIKLTCTACVKKRITGRLLQKAHFKGHLTFTFLTFQLKTILVTVLIHFCKSVILHCGQLLWIDNKPYITVCYKANSLFFGAKWWVCSILPMWTGKYWLLKGIKGLPRILKIFSVSVALSSVLLKTRAEASFEPSEMTDSYSKS